MTSAIFRIAANQYIFPVIYDDQNWLADGLPPKLV